MSPALRRALHVCVDLLCDALAEDAESKPVKRRRARAEGAIEPLALDELSPHLRAQLEKKMAAAGFKKTG